MLWTLRALIESAATCSTEVNGRWVPARPINWKCSRRGRLRAAWLVLTGRADAVIWPEGQ